MKVYNTLSGQKEEFVPQGDEVTMYVCGINPYADAHIGHAMSYLFFDVVRRYLEFRGYKVKHVQNITDIEDNIIAHANELGVSVQELTQKYVERYDEDMEALNVLPAHVYPRAMGEIDKMIEIVQGLVEKGFAYAVGGTVYFRVRNTPDYGKLSGRSLEQMRAGARIEVGEDKEDPMDFLLWKEAKPGEPSWDSPWGKGRPGWHIECSAMSIRYLGEQIDIHGGGQDVLFPHHENEIAQSESFTGKKPFVKYWLHNGLLKMHETDEEKMSRSLGNLITIREALEKYSADAIRLFVLHSYYRSPLTYDEVTLEAAEAGLNRLRNAAHRTSDDAREPEAARELYESMTGNKAGIEASAEIYRERFISAMDDDFGTARAVNVVFDLASEINRAINLGYYEEGEVSHHRETFMELTNVLGFKLEAPDHVGGRVINGEVDDNIVAELQGPKLYKLLDDIKNIATDPDQDIETARYDISLALACRNRLRKAKQFQLADAIRDKLNELGITLEDTPQGTVWRL